MVLMVAVGILLLMNPTLFQSVPSTEVQEKTLVEPAKSADNLPAAIISKEISKNAEATFLISGLTQKTSNIHIAVFNSEAGFPKTEFSFKKAIFTTDEDQIQFSLELPYNKTLAVAVFQDLDENKILSKNAFGIPTEPYGLSNNARGVIGPPTFSQAAFLINSNHKSTEPIKIHLR
jgi:uncharacterized protein (DUF2141 family)